MNVKIAHIGLSNEFISHKLNTYPDSHSPIPNAAPELFLRPDYNDSIVNVWQLRIILYSMVTETLPFMGEDFL